MMSPCAEVRMLEIINNQHLFGNPNHLQRRYGMGQVGYVLAEFKAFSLLLNIVEAFFSKKQEQHLLKVTFA